MRRLPGTAIPTDFFAGDTVRAARKLIGCLLARREDDGSYSAGIIVETEAYVGEDDPACHAAAGCTPRTRVLYGPPGRTYVYFSYGMHHLLNVVCRPAGEPAAVLLRALRPVAGVERMAERRGRRLPRELASGPGKLTQALGIDLEWNDRELGQELVLRWGSQRPPVASGFRVGIRKGRERPWRFWWDGDPSVSVGPVRYAPTP